MSSDFTLAYDVTNTSKYGNKWNGLVDADGVVTAGFLSTGEDLILSFDAYDVDTAIEIEVLLNGASLGYLAKGANNGISHYTFTIGAELQQAGTNEITFRQAENVTYVWGVTNVLLQVDTPPPPDFTLVYGETETGQYGNNWNGHTDADGLINAAFESTGQDLILSLDAYDVDTAIEIEVLVNGVSLGFLAQGVNDGLSHYQLLIGAEFQQAGTNEITFRQAENLTYRWGVTNVELDPYSPGIDFMLAYGILEPGQYGNKWNGHTDADGLINAAFESTGQDLILSLDAYDVDTAIEIEVLLNGASLGYLAKGANNGISHYTFTIGAELQQAGTNEITFRQAENVTYVWGVTNVLLQVDTPPPPDFTLVYGETETGQYGNNWNGHTDADGLINAAFESTGQDLILSLDAYDVDTAIEIEVLVNGVSLGFLAQGVNDGLSHYQLLIGAEFQQAGTNEITFRQAENLTYRWASPMSSSTPTRRVSTSCLPTASSNPVSTATSGMA